jgi:YidC/Oxa1 family membrane protein insertase
LASFHRRLSGSSTPLSASGGPKPHPAWQASGPPAQRRFASSVPEAATPAAAAATTTATPPHAPVFPDPVVDSNSILDQLDGASLLDLPEQIGYLKSLGLSYGWGPTAGMQWLLEHIYIYTGIPWWGSIALTALAVRAALFRPALVASEQSAKFAELRQTPKFAETQRRAMEALRDPERRQEGMQLRREMGFLQKQAGVKIWKSFVPLLQIPVGFGMFRLLRGMSGLPVPSMETGGFLWFTDLTVPDPYFLLPIASSGLMWWIMKVFLDVPRGSLLTWLACPHVTQQAESCKIVRLTMLARPRSNNCPSRPNQAERS